MTTQIPFEDILAEIRHGIPQALLDRWAAEDEQFKRNVADYVATLMTNTAAPDESAPLLALQGRMLEHLLLKREPEEPISPAELADAIGERNRKAVRQAGRLLAAKGVITAQTEPDASAEGERVLNYAYVEAIEVALNAFLDSRNKAFTAEVAAAAKQ